VPERRIPQRLRADGDFRLFGSLSLLPYRLQRSGYWTCNFQPYFARANTLVLKPQKDRFARQLTEFLDDQLFSTVFYAETRENPHLPRSDIFAE
jgi:hypothetical protein